MITLNGILSELKLKSLNAIVAGAGDTDDIQFEDNSDVDDGAPDSTTED